MDKSSENFMRSLRFSHKFNELTVKIVEMESKLGTLSGKQIDQLSSTFDQMTKIINDIMEDK